MVPVGKSTRCLKVIWFKKTWSVARESNRGRGAQITVRYYWANEEFSSKRENKATKAKFKKP